MSKLKVTLCQMAVGTDKAQNIQKAVSMVSAAAARGAQFVVLPECFNCPYGTQFFDAYSEALAPGNQTYDAMSAVAKAHQVWLVAGSIPEKKDGKLFNASMTFSPDGSLVHVHRKVHLFRLFTDAVKFDEAEVLTAGDDASAVTISENLKFGVGVCFDIRYPQLAWKLAREGTSFIVYPGAFNMVTGPAHWELSARARAVDNQQYVLLCSPARDTSAGYVAWGHSLIVDPLGAVVASTDEKESYVDAELDFSLVAQTRDQIPILKGQRNDLYSITWGSSLSNHVRAPPTVSSTTVSSVQEAEIVDEKVTWRASQEDADIRGSIDSTRITSGDVSVLGHRESFSVEMHKLQYMYSQDGPFIGSRMKDKGANEVEKRTRRHMVRVPQPEQEYRPNETSFRRLPKDLRLPNEFELRALYPMSTNLKIIEGKADCVDHNAFAIDEEPAPIAYSMLAPPDWSPSVEHPYMVVLPDHRGIPRDFEDVCANFFERPVHHQLMLEQRFVILSPVINLRHNLQVPVEAVVARFCDWACETFKVENGKVHLFGKGNGGYVALRTILEHKDLALSVTAILGRGGSPFRPLDRAQDKIKNYNGVHSLVFVPGLLRKQDWYYKFKFMMDMARVRPPLRNVHFADVRDHQVYYAINPYEFWNYMLYFRQYNVKMITESGHTW